jgi:hypothetical protein
VAEPDVLSNEVLAVRVTSGSDGLGVVLNVGDHPADVVLPFPAAAVVAGSAELRHDGGGSAVRVPPHDYALVSSTG